MSKANQVSTLQPPVKSSFNLTWYCLGSVSLVWQGVCVSTRVVGQVSSEEVGEVKLELSEM